MSGFVLPWQDMRSPAPGPNFGADWLLALSCGVFFLIPSWAAALWLCRARITVDEAGLRWQGLGPRRSALWAEVTDYYECLPQKKSSTVFVVIETACGRLKFDSSWSHSDSLRSLVVRRAAHARVTEWGVLGTRPEDAWPRAFDYEPRGIRRTQIVLVCMTVGALAAPMWHMASHLARDLGAGAFGWDLAGLGLWGLTMGS